MKTGLIFARRFYVSIFVLGLVLLLGSCTNTKKVTYFNDLNEGVISNTVASLEPVIQKSDILSITVTSPNPEATVMFNAPNMALPSSTAPGSGNIAPALGYLVSPEGFIDFPGLGKVQAAGITKQQLKDNITASLVNSKLLVNPIVTVRYLNYRVTVLGEVARPTVVTVPNERISILEAIGLAGDLTIYGKRENVLIIREEKGAKVIKRVNLNNSEIFSSPYYYLKSNDIVYVEPNNARIAASSRTQQLLPTMISALSFIAVIFTYIIGRR